MLQDIVRYYTKARNFDAVHLSRILDDIRAEKKTNEIEADPIHNGYSGFTTHVKGNEKLTKPIEDKSTVSQDDPSELSHSCFAESLQKNLLKDLLPSEVQALHKPNYRHLTSTTHTNRVSALEEAVQAFPPLEIARFLVDAFFSVAQTNYSYVDESALIDKLTVFYADSFIPQEADASWLCILLMVFAIGIQFAHLRSGARDEVARRGRVNPLPDINNYEHVALQLYTSAKALLPDVIVAAAVEGVQALVLLGVYILPLDAGGLSRLYLGIAMKIAICNDLHHTFKSCFTARELEMRNRIWWTVYTLERRISVFHGRPMSITRCEVSADLPTTYQDASSLSRTDTTPNIIAMIWLTCFVEDGRERLLAYKQSSVKFRAESMRSITSLRDKTNSYWESLPEQVDCRDLDPLKPLFRFNVHLALTYHLVHIFIGRTFILGSPCDNQERSNTANQDDSSNKIDANCDQVQQMLAMGSLQHSLEIIDLCKRLQHEVGLSSSSYTEYTSCCAALLVILAQRMKTRDQKLRRVSNIGVQLLKSMAVGLYDDNSDKLAIEVLETAVRRLDDSSQSDGANQSDGYGRFRHWTSSVSNRSSSGAHSRPTNGLDVSLASRSMRSGIIEHDRSIDTEIHNFHTPNIMEPLDPDPFDFAAFLADSNDDIGSIPGMDQWFRYGFR